MQDPSTKQSAHRRRCRSRRKSHRTEPARPSEYPLSIPSPKAVNVSSSYFCIHTPQTKEAGQSRDFVLGSKHDAYRPDRGWKSKPFSLSKSSTKLEMTFAVNTRARYRFVERRLGGPLGDRIVRCCVLKNSDFCPVEFIKTCRRIGGEEVC